jgi:hypothetical protein
MNSASLQEKVSKVQMSIDLSTAVSSALTYLNVGLHVLRVAPGDNKPVKHFKWKAFEHTIPAQERVNSLIRGTDVNIVNARGVPSLIHRHGMAQQLPRLKREEWP